MYCIWLHKEINPSRSTFSVINWTSTQPTPNKGPLFTGRSILDQSMRRLLS